MDNNIPTGFISVEEAISLIESDTRSNAKVGTAFLLRNIPYLRVGGNYTRQKLKHENGKVVDAGEEFVHIFSDYKRSMLEHAIIEHYKMVTGRDIDPESIGIKKLMTTVDDEKNLSGRIMQNTESSTKVGDTLVSGATQTVGN